MALLLVSQHRQPLAALLAVAVASVAVAAAAGSPSHVVGIGYQLPATATATATSLPLPCLGLGLGPNLDTLLSYEPRLDSTAAPTNELKQKPLPEN